MMKHQSLEKLMGVNRLNHSKQNNIHLTDWLQLEFYGLSLWCSISEEPLLPFKSRTHGQNWLKFKIYLRNLFFIFVWSVLSSNIFTDDILLNMYRLTFDNFRLRWRDLNGGHCKHCLFYSLGAIFYLISFIVLEEKHIRENT